MSAAPVGGIDVDLASSNPAVTMVPARVRVPAGRQGENFPVTTNPVEVAIK